MLSRRTESPRHVQSKGQTRWPVTAAQVLYFQCKPLGGVLPDGVKVEGPASLRETLLGSPDQFASTLAEKLLTFALGRGLDYNDAPAVRRIAAQAAARDYRFSSIVSGIVQSTPFQMKVR